MKKIFGKIKITVSSTQKNQAMNVILINSLSYKSANIMSDGTLEIIILTSWLDRFKSSFENNAIEAEYGIPYGILASVEKYRKRWGVLAGLFILVLSVFISSKFVWRIEIFGNSTVSDEEIISSLEKVGCRLGTFIPRINYDKLHNEFLLECGDISWISVNIDGNVAHVMVRERLYEENKDNKKTYTNVVAKYDGQIALVQLYEGKKIISIGDVVKKGDILISGVIDSQSQGVRYVHADGEIKAYVNKEILIKIPFNTSEKVYTGVVHKNKSIKIFSKIINFFTKNKNYDDFCDRIDTRRKVTIFGNIELPIEILQEKYYEYKYVDKTYTIDEIVDVAFAELRYRMDKELKNAELISKNISTSYDSEYFYISCNLYCLEDIATLVEFQVDGK